MIRRQKILILVTERRSLRADVLGFSGEDGNLIKFDEPIGMSHTLKDYGNFPTPMHAIGDGWRLMGPPIPTPYQLISHYEWWLEKYETNNGS